MAHKKVALVTGSNKGIGLAVVRALCNKFDGDVILCSRDTKRGEDAVAKLQAEGLQPKLRTLDISDPQSVTATRDFLVQEYGGLDVLVNNAAIIYMDPTVKPMMEIAKDILGVNYNSTASVCEILFPILRPGARVVNVGSSAGMLMEMKSEERRQRLASAALTRKDLDDMIQEFYTDILDGKTAEHGWPNPQFITYMVAKICLAALTWIQHRELLSDDRKDIIINVVHPGYVDTDLTMHTGPLSPDQGAEPIVKCCLIPEGGSPRGQMIWWDGRVVDWVSDVLELTDGPPGAERRLPQEV